MYQLFEKRLSHLINSGQQGLLCGGLIGLEKETLRVGKDGKIAQTAHPYALGSALTHPYITTDYSEALTEIITPPFSDLSQALQFLALTQAFVYQHLSDELLWATSMPCVVAGDTSIPIAQYGSSNAGLMKTVYRRGLGHRYGRAMQVIAGVHYNYSVPEEFWPCYQALEGDDSPRQAFISARYFDLIRNLLRFGWLIPYLFGASPAICKSFLASTPHNLEAFDANTYYEPYATSLRMGDIGYQNNKEKASGVKACYDSLEEYIASLDKAISAPYKGYEKFGIFSAGEYQQLNTNILQIENEYYSTVRPKQVLDGNEKPILALKKRGVQYIELRSLDVNAFDPLGINEHQARFLEAFMLFCLLHDSPDIDTDEQAAIDMNEIQTAHQGRSPGFRLNRHGKPQALHTWALELCDVMQGLCHVLDEGSKSRAYTTALNMQVDCIKHPELTPSARMLEEMRAENEGFFDYALHMSKQHEAYFRNIKISDDSIEKYNKESMKSHQKQTEMEAEPQPAFEQYLEAYFKQT